MNDTIFEREVLNANVGLLLADPILLNVVSNIGSDVASDEWFQQIAVEKSEKLLEFLAIVHGLGDRNKTR